jgi:hypothetical protein
MEDSVMLRLPHQFSRLCLFLPTLLSAATSPGPSGISFTYAEWGFPYSGLPGLV